MQFASRIVVAMVVYVASGCMPSASTEVYGEDDGEDDGKDDGEEPAPAADGEEEQQNAEDVDAHGAGNAKRDGGTDGAQPSSIPDPAATPPPPGRVPMFVAVGPGLRTTLSCDDGRTWIENKFAKETDNDFSHDETNIHGATFTDGKFYYPAGWGDTTTRVFASDNGIDWQQMYLGGAHQSNTMAAGAGVIVFGEGRSIRRSADGGMTWQTIGLPEGYAHMRMTYADHNGGRFVLGGREKRHAYSTDGGRSWSKSQGDGGHRPVFGGGVFVSFQQHGGSLSRSTNGGATWQPVQCCGNPGFIANVFWTGRQFLLFADAGVWGSVDGLTWQRQAAAGNGQFTAMARDPQSGTFVAARAGRPVKFFRSTDGLKWVALAPSAYDARGDEIKYIAFGFARPSGRCPLQ